ncbi:FAD binding domain-containing protein [Rhodoplanes sp. TEM]|uniref:FAD binding domain-containing protein n=1 Tax=Rhodoplanes tepidamans TaxID=200616 RepID=A0ABT5JB48_RHOTP|nr:MULTISPECIES: FAD binding domain-containing protein [Rhodoplanes]MDC7786773.1 FAD binding domain-containing protein [Rhodoplanes tepidamans]MDC7987461.1 FAD binding domain-containing protein [Rhodoplanes sp. TEM]MDQ0356328.1 carbon-monoxide dehydrogenase medium subunit [Rhodoplanes tepidamans]
MKPAEVDYVRAETVEHALALLAETGVDSKVLAGGQSLMPLLAMRLAGPERLIDIGRVPGLDRLEIVGDRLVIGALVRHHRVATDPLVARAAPLLAAAAPHVAHPAIRNRGTFGGSLSHADPASEFPACALALGADIVLVSAAGRRTVPAETFFEGLYQTALGPDELLLEVSIPVATPDARFAFVEFARRSGDYALAGLAAAARADGDRLADLRLAFFGIGDVPVLAAEAAAILASGPHAETAIAAAVATLDAIEVRDSAAAGAAYRRHLARVALRRAARALARPEAAACR